MRPSLSLFRPEAYLRQFDRLRVKARQRGRASEAVSEGVSLSQLGAADAELCAVLATEVRRGHYEFAPLRRSEVLVDGKWRTIHRPDLLDALVLGAIASRLTALLESVLSDCVHAYRPKRSSLGVVERFRRELKEHRQSHSLHDRGLFVLQRDLSAYGESIPTDAASRLWPLLDEALQKLGDPEERAVMRRLVASGCRPRVLLPGGDVITLEHGLPTGSPIQQPLANLYLTPLDEVLRARNVFYARFGDDLFVATPSSSEAEGAALDLECVVGELELSFNPDKTRNSYFTKPGRPLEGATQLPFAPTSHVEYLGVRVNFDGRIGLSRKRMRKLLQRSRLRIENSARMAPQELARDYVAVALNHALTAQSEVSDPAVQALHLWVDDREQLRQLDRHLAQLCAEVLSGKRGVRAFRHTSVTELRKAGLSSLIQVRRRRSQQ